MDKNESGVNFTETENKIRKRWLFWSTILPGTLSGCCLFTGIFAALSSDFMLLSGILLLSFVIAVGFYMNYHCAYKNPGTILLLLIIIVNSLILLKIFFNLVIFALIKMSPIFFLFLSVQLIFEITVIYYSYKLRNINKKIKERRITTSPVYVNALSAFSTATNLEELNHQFVKLKSIDDSESTIQILVKAYDQQKKC